MADITKYTIDFENNELEPVYCSEYEESDSDEENSSEPECCGFCCIDNHTEYNHSKFLNNIIDYVNMEEEEEENFQEEYHYESDESGYDTS